MYAPLLAVVFLAATITSGHGVELEVTVGNAEAVARAKLTAEVDRLRAKDAEQAETIARMRAKEVEQDERIRTCETTMQGLTPHLKHAINKHVEATHQGAYTKALGSSVDISSTAVDTTKSAVQQILGRSLAEEVGFTEKCSQGKGVQVLEGAKNPTLACVKPELASTGGCNAVCSPSHQTYTNQVPTFCAINCIKSSNKKFDNRARRVWCHFQKLILCPTKKKKKFFRAGKNCFVQKRADLLRVTKDKGGSEEEMREQGSIVQESMAQMSEEQILDDVPDAAKKYHKNFGLCRDILLPN